MLLRSPERGLGILEARRGFSRRLRPPHKSEGVPPFDHQALARQDAVVSDPEHAALFFVPAMVMQMAGNLWHPYKYLEEARDAHPGLAPSTHAHPDLLLARRGPLPTVPPLTLPPPSSSQVRNYLRGAYPYWNRSSGTDHVFFLTTDRSGCWKPKALEQYADPGARLLD